jgi:hypothetical protein
VQAGAGRALEQQRLAPARSARPQLERRVGAHERASLVVVGRRQQLGERHVDERRVAVPRLAVGERELGALDDRVDALGGVHGLQREPGE